jgi:hypothetical protein
MDKKPPQTPEMKAFQAYLDGKMSPRKKQEIRAQITTTWLIERVRQQSRLRKSLASTTLL